MILLDTHVVVWLLADDDALGRRARAIIDEAFHGHGVSVSAISFFEVATLSRRGRISLPDTTAVWRKNVLRLGVEEVPVDGDIAAIAAGLEDLHGDPADRLIAATAMVIRASLLTADDRLLKWRSSVPRIDARR